MLQSSSQFSFETFPITPKSSFVPFCNKFSLSFQPGTFSGLFPVPTDFLFWIFYINEIIQYVMYFFWLLALKITFSTFMLQNISIFGSFLLLNYTMLFGYNTFCLSIQQLINIVSNLGLFG